MRRQCFARASAILMVAAVADVTAWSGRSGHDPQAGPDRPVEHGESHDPCASALTVHVALPALPRDAELVAVLHEEVGRIWSRYAIAFDWTLPPEPILPSELPDVWVMTASGPPISSLEGDVLAGIFFAGERPTNQIRLAAPSSIVEVLRQRRHPLVAAPPGGSMQQRLIGRILGRALAHELGHYLLASKTHDASGLMRAELPLFEMAEPHDRGGFVLDAGRVAALRARRRSACTALVANRRASRSAGTLPD